MQRATGFTLIEVLVTVAIVAILAAIAIPNYTDYVKRGKLTEATSTLLSMRTKMEQYFQDNRSYTTPGAPVLAPCVANSAVPVPPLKYFTITCPVLTATTYTIQADGTDPTLLGITYTIDQGNVRATQVTAGSPMDQSGYTPNNNCWTVRKGGQC